MKQAGSSGEASLPAVSAVAVIGAEGSPRTMQMADLFSVFEVPQLSYASSSALLDDKIKFSYFSRTVPSDNMQVRVPAVGKGGREGVLECMCIFLFISVIFNDFDVRYNYNYVHSTGQG